MANKLPPLTPSPGLVAALEEEDLPPEKKAYQMSIEERQEKLLQELDLSELKNWPQEQAKKAKELLLVHGCRPCCDRVDSLVHVTNQSKCACKHNDDHQLASQPQDGVHGNMRHLQGYAGPVPGVCPVTVAVSWYSGIFWLLGWDWKMSTNISQPGIVTSGFVSPINAICLGVAPKCAHDHPLLCMGVLRPALFQSLQLCEPFHSICPERGADLSGLCWPGCIKQSHTYGWIRCLFTLAWASEKQSPECINAWVYIVAEAVLKVQLQRRVGKNHVWSNWQSRVQLILIQLHIIPPLQEKYAVFLQQ